MEKSIHTHEYQAFTATLRQIRESSQVTQTELAERIGENQVFVSRYETGQTRLDYLQVRTICHALGTSLASFNRKFEKQLEKG